MPLLRHLLAVVVVLVASALYLPVVQAQEANVGLRVRGFTADAKQMLVEVRDVNTGFGLRLYDVDTGKPAKKAQLHVFEPAEQIKVLRDSKRRYKIVDPGVEDLMGPLLDDPSKSVSAFGIMAEPTRFVLAITDRVRLGKLRDVAVRSDEETKTLARVTLRTVYWTTDRTTLVAVVTQRLETEGYQAEVDELVPVRYVAGAVQWVDPVPGTDCARAQDRRQGQVDVLIGARTP
jgi:hypothetical protein